ncbi:Hint domain-containing protein [Frigidibacter sp. RF13]|uniref:Hint domain-containing protein n=1 Tax=Frigidibacter sp. RF13 TaxID=2997340 RepID=UPI0022714187|nr:Hint domain-containing protein [Frigidibacter sp. RF13]MCY1126278.1 Hint domain-containing protein [Frigidibacter sp. RF13]
MEDDSTIRPGPAVQAYQAGAIRVVVGANLRDPVGGVEDLELGDVYRLKPEARTKRLVLSLGGAPGAAQQVAGGSDIGKPGDLVYPLAVLTFLAPDGERLALVTVWHEASETTFALPLSPMVPGVEYTLVEAHRDFAGLRLGDVICVSFAAGTLITRPGGAPEAIEKLKIGDPVLTRDNGPQPIRWIGKATLRAAGSFAPVVISAGTLGNLGELVVSPHHRIFLYQRGARRLGGTAEVLVQAKHLVDGDRVWRREGGFVDYYSLVFDRHEIIFAEGVAAESLMVNEETVRLLPEDLADDLRSRFPGLRQSQYYGTEAGARALESHGRQHFFRPERKS